MTLKSYLFVMSVLTTISWVIFLFVANLVNPEITNWFGFLLFYCSLFLALSGFISLLGFIIRSIVLKEKLAFRLVKVSFKQSFLVALFIIILLILKSQHLFNWINSLLLVIIFIILELFLVSYKKSYK